MNLFKLFLSVTLPYIYSQNSCDNCITEMIRGENIDCTEMCQHQTTHLTDCLEYTRCLYDYNIRKVHNICLCEKTDCDYEYACPHIEKIEFKNNNIEGYTTYEVSLELKDLNSNIYAIYGDPINNMIIPEAYQLPDHQGANIGGINPLLIQYIPDTQYDSWLTIQLTDGNPSGQVDAIGIDFSSWNDNTPLIVIDGAIFLDDPLQQLSNNKKYVIAHLTLRNNQVHRMIINVNGRTNVNNHESGSYAETDVVIDFPIIYENSEH